MHTWFHQLPVLRGNVASRHVGALVDGVLSKAGQYDVSYLSTLYLVLHIESENGDGRLPIFES